MLSSDTHVYTATSLLVIAERNHTQTEEDDEDYEPLYPDEELSNMTLPSFYDSDELSQQNTTTHIGQLP